MWRGGVGLGPRATLGKRVSSTIAETSISKIVACWLQCPCCSHLGSWKGQCRTNRRNGGILDLLTPKWSRLFETCEKRGAWVARSVKRPTSAQVKISRFMSSSPVSGSVLTAQSLEPVSDSVSPSLCDPPPFMLCLSLSQKINKR